jgi:hypothetical protein
VTASIKEGTGFRNLSVCREPVRSGAIRSPLQAGYALVAQINNRYASPSCEDQARTELRNLLPRLEDTVLGLNRRISKAIINSMVLGRRCRSAITRGVIISMLTGFSK